MTGVQTCALPISDGYIVLKGRKIAGVSTGLNGNFEGKYDVITPALDRKSVV